MIGASYSKGPFSAYANLAHAVDTGRGLITSQFSFDQATLNYAKSHDIYLDHDQDYALSAGASYLWRGTRIGADLIYGSGLRRDLDLANPIAYPDGSQLDAIPNGATVPGYTQVNLALSHLFDLGAAGTLQARLDVINLADARYEIRDGSGVGVFAPQYGARRGVFVGMSKSF